MRKSRLLCGLLLFTALPACTSTSARDITRDCEHCPEMVIVPAGTAILGAAASDGFRNSDELPERTFPIRAAFAVSRHEITRDQYEAFVRASHRTVHGDCLTDRTQRGNWVIDPGTTFRDPGFAQKGNDPVACVSWDEAQAYVAWLNTQTRGGYRLLTEVEWEYVARAGASQNVTYPWGSDAAAGCSFANGFDQTTMATYKGLDTSGHKVFDPLNCSDGWLNTAPVGSLAPNEFGVFDMIGNVSEWVGDCHSTSHDALSESGTLPTSASPCSRRLAKGGSWGTLAHNLRTSERLPYAATHRDDSIGIRVAKTLRLAAADQEAEQQAILAVIGRMEKAWNRGDFHGYMEGFANPDVVFVSRGEFQKDWQGTLDHYIRDYGGAPDRRGKLHFFDIKIELLAPDAAQLISRYRLDRPHGAQDGINTRLMRKRDDKWVIALNHVSSREMP